MPDFQAQSIKAGFGNPVKAKSHNPRPITSHSYIIPEDLCRLSLVSSLLSFCFLSLLFCFFLFSFFFFLLLPLTVLFALLFKNLYDYSLSSETERAVIVPSGTTIWRDMYVAVCCHYCPVKKYTVVKTDLQEKSPEIPVHRTSEILFACPPACCRQGGQTGLSPG